MSLLYQCDHCHTTSQKSMQTVLLNAISNDAQNFICEACYVLLADFFHKKYEVRKK